LHHEFAWFACLSGKHPYYNPDGFPLICNVNKTESHYEIERLEERLQRIKALLIHTSVRMAEIKLEIKAKKKMLAGSPPANKKESD